LLPLLYDFASSALLRRVPAWLPDSKAAVLGCLHLYLPAWPDAVMPACVLL
jgi:hypothetical protein